MRYDVVVNDEAFHIEVGSGGKVWVDGRLYHVDLATIENGRSHSLLLDHH